MIAPCHSPTTPPFPENTPCPFTIAGTGHAVPQTCVPSTELDQKLGLEPGSVEKRSGVQKRYFAQRNETAAQLAARAALQALAAAGMELDQIDCLVSASGTQDQGMPCNAALIHRELGLSRRGIPAFDINASCLSFLAALDILRWPIVAGHWKNVLLVSSDIASCGLDWRTLEASAIFGDGAAAAVLRKGDSGSRLLATSLHTYSQGADYCRIPAGGSRHHPTRTEGDFETLALFQMQGKNVFRLASQHMPAFLDDLLACAGITQDMVDWVVPHQASHLALSHLTKKLGRSQLRSATPLVDIEIYQRID